MTLTRLVQIKFLPRGEGINVYVEREILNHSVLLHPQYGLLNAEHFCRQCALLWQRCVPSGCLPRGAVSDTFLLCLTPARLGWRAASSSSGRCF